MYYSQKDERWTDVKIATKTLGEVGCLITSLANIYEDHYRVEVTPVDVLDRLRCNNGITTDNLVVWDAAKKVLGCQNIDFNYKGSLDYAIGRYYIVNYLNFGYGHFTNLLSRISENRLKVYDVYTGKIIEKKISDIRRVVRVDF